MNWEKWVCKYGKNADRMGLVGDSGEFKVDFGRYFVRLFEWIPATAYAWIPATAYAWIPATAYAWIPAKESHHHIIKKFYAKSLNNPRNK